jgi:hypothetical protein
LKKTITKKGWQSVSNSECEALSSNPSTTKKEKKEKEKGQWKSFKQLLSDLLLPFFPCSRFLSRQAIKARIPFSSSWVIESKSPLPKSQT